MTFALPNSWVWDFWLADEGHRYHLYYLHAPHSLGDPELRHRNARIGHAISRDLVTWEPLGIAIAPGPKGTPDETATWTGSVVHGPDGMWWMFYTGSYFPSPDSNTNIETICLASAPDPGGWNKHDGVAIRADPLWYETLGTSSWPEEAWRDPWVFSDPAAGPGWHMLITARANNGDDAGRGVIGHATSPDLRRWTVGPPLSAPQSGFGHLEVPQVLEVDGRWVLVFCCNAPRLANFRSGQVGGIWVARAEGPLGPYDIAGAELLVTEELYAGRIVRDRRGQLALMAFRMAEPDGSFAGSITDPMPVVLDKASGLLRLA